MALISASRDVSALMSVSGDVFFSVLFTFVVNFILTSLCFVGSAFAASSALLCFLGFLPIPMVPLIVMCCLDQKRELRLEADMLRNLGTNLVENVTSEPVRVRIPDWAYCTLEVLKCANRSGFVANCYCRELNQFHQLRSMVVILFRPL